MRRMLMLILLAAALLPSAATADWLAYGGDAQVTNAVAARGITPTNVGKLQRDWQVKLDGPVVASPLYVSSVETPGYRGDLVIAATQAGSIYALRAESGTEVWRRNLGTREACGQRWGISSTPFVDRKRNRVFVASAAGVVFALDLASGRTLSGWPVRVIERRITGVEHVWGGLRLHRGFLYVPIASYCNRPDDKGRRADGRLVAIAPGEQKITRILDLVPGPGNQGGIWAWGGVSIDPSGRWLYAGTANAHVEDPECGCVLEAVANAEKVLRLSRELKVIEGNRPRGIPHPVGDTDFGGTPVLFQPDGCPPLAALNSKNGQVYVWRRHRLSSGPIWSSGLIAPTEPSDSLIGQPSYSPRHRTLFVSHTFVWRDGQRFGGMTAFRVEEGCRFTKIWATPTGAGPQPPPIVVGNVVFSATGAFSGVADVVALDASSGETLWTGTVGGVVWAPPIADGGRVFAAGADSGRRTALDKGTLVAFGLRTNTTRGSG